MNVASFSHPHRAALAAGLTAIGAVCAAAVIVLTAGAAAAEPYATTLLPFMAG